MAGSATQPSKSTTNIAPTDASSEPEANNEPEQTPPPETEAEPETFDRAYVEALREEAAGHRTRAGRADALAATVVAAWAEASGLLQDADDLPVTADLNGEDGLPDRDKVTAAIADLIARKPHLRSRRPVGSIPQGAEQTETGVSLADLLRTGAA